MISVDDRAKLVLEEAWALLPPAKEAAWLTCVSVEDLGAKHGSYAPTDGSIMLSERLFWGIDAWELMTIDQHGTTPAVDGVYCSRALHTTIHECAHAIGYGTGLDRQPGWWALSGWQETWEDRQSMGRYFERRPGWGDQGGSEWAYRKGTWFAREYSAKSPHEDFADCVTHIALGWHTSITNTNGRAKVRYLLRALWGEDGDDRLAAARGHWRTRWDRKNMTLGER